MPILNCSVRKQVKGRNPEPSPELLAHQGPIVPVTLSLSDAMQGAFQELGRQVPGPAQGYALIDTGATATCMDESAARRAGLPITGTGTIASASHAAHAVPLFSGKLTLDGLNVAAHIRRGMGVILSGFPDVIALIGRDLLQTAVLVYNGPGGHVSLAL